MAIPFVFRSDAEVEAFFDGEPLPDGPAPVERARRSPRKPTIDKLIAKAKAAGATSVVIEGVEMRFGEPQAEQANDLDKWMAKRHAH